MRDFVKLKKNRVIACLVSVIMLASLFLSLFYIVMEAGHECEGEECHVCECVEQCMGAVRRLCEGTPHILVFAALIFFVAVTGTLSEQHISFETLVSKKIRMND